ncbi:tripartite tricarboxylate transporter TctB family protein [Falsirhodobacter sp. 20TX0035]|uniref:tripartite tricarboxylate transporter TctB family protein n=1 Tax=Falsirhodobacter sp. 20TX0035 TaxID=3022019 RepID=UPI00232C1138|nr:tripartite tricarboxylate transporter TctB family protein [Falsirhodobacter sp. 20TX0035]MDB6454174.1 tripartite tricarboxylate transporter TctB family protein [Falsirhodobacter sp. 20TX0035]
MSNNRTLGAVALLMAAILAIFGWGLVAPFAYEPVGPRAFPMITALVIGICGAILLVQGGGEAEPVNRKTLIGLIMLCLTLLIYAVLFERLGYVLSTLGMSTVVALIFGAKPHQAILSAVVLSVGSYLLFDHGLDVVLPTGLLGDLL